ncbi:MAG: zinc-dependent metalloprotease [Planctomycetota bacterium]|nr:zinc-dependent metalloprotease [Planctomycetota bacterium]
MSMRHTLLAASCLAALGVIATEATALQESTEAMPAETVMAPGSGSSKPEFPTFDSVTKDYTKVVSTADGKSGMYTLFVNDKTGKVLAELPRNFERQKVFVAFTIKGGVSEAGVQSGDMYAYWKRFGKRLALIQPNFEVRTTGDTQSKAGHRRVHTDRVILDVPIVTMGPKGGPVIDLSSLLVNQSTKFFGGRTAGANTRLAKIAKAKAFPKNVELAFELPLRGGKFGTIYYSIAEIPENTGYKPREADERLGYFVTSHRDIGDASDESPWKRYINRWHLQKADSKLKLSPPKEPIVFYIEHTTPVRYRRWVRDGILEWNKAYEKVGIINAIEVYQQDESTGAHMEKDPEDARYNFVLWTNSDMGFAIGPSRVHPKTGQILDADIVMDEGFITGWSKTWEDLIPQMAMENFGPETYTWLEKRPNWDPRVTLAPPSQQDAIRQNLAREAVLRANGQLPGHHEMLTSSDPTLMGDDLYDGLSGRVSQVNGACQHASCKAFDVALFRLNYDLIMNLEQPVSKDDDADTKKADLITGTWHGMAEFNGPEGMSQEMPFSMDLELHSDNSVTGSVEMGPMGSQDISGDWDPKASTLTIAPTDEEDSEEDPMVLTLEDGRLTGEMSEDNFTLTLWAERESAVTGDVAEVDSEEIDEEVDVEEDEEVDDEETDEEDEEVAKTGKASRQGDIQLIDVVPESFIGPQLKDVIMHEVGHTLGLRHNFKGSRIYELDEMNAEEMAGQAIGGSVMDYLPVNINYGEDANQGDYTMVTIGPYDYWVIEYGYGKNPKKVLERVAEEQLAYATDEDTWGPDPTARRFDNAKNPLDYADSQMALVKHLRSRIIEDMVDDGESWAEARKAYELLLGKHASSVGIASNWIGGSYLNRHKKGDPDAQLPIENIPAEQQRRALAFVLDNTMQDECYGLSPELLHRMTVDKWYDNGGMRFLFQDETFPVHGRISGVQSMALSQVLNPTTLQRIYDNEFRAMGEEDVLTVPETMDAVKVVVWAELEEDPGSDVSNRKPYVSSLRRNLQRNHVDRLIDMSMPSNGMGSAAAPVSNLSRMQLREILADIKDVKTRGMDAYSKAHLAEASSKIERALDAQYLYNTDDISGGSIDFGYLFMQENESDE